MDSGDCNLSPRRHVPDLNQSDSGSKQHVDWLLYQRATVLSTISPHMSVTSSINPYDVSILTCGDGQSTKLTVNASQLRPFDKYSASLLLPNDYN